MQLSTSPMKFYANLNVATVDDCLKSASPALVTMKAELGEQKMLAILVLFITDAIEFFNIGKGMNGEQVVQTAKLIAKDYYFLKPEDFKLCFENAKRGRYGKLFDRMDGAIIMEWLDNYVNGRMNHAEQRSEEKHNEGKFFDYRQAQRLRAESDEREKEFHKVQVQEYVKNLNNNKPAVR